MANYQKILVLLDLSDSSEVIVAAGRDIAAHSNAAMLLLHVVEYIPSEPMGETLMPTVQIEADLEERAKSQLAELSSRLKLPRATTQVAAGNKKTEILRVAKEEAVDLIVLGSRVRHGLGVLVNFTEDTVLHAAHCDVLAIRLR
jgi:universal stress protein A